MIPARYRVAAKEAFFSQRLMLFMEDCFIRHSGVWKETAMKRDMWRVVTVVALVLLPGLVSAQERKADIRLEPDLVYGKGGDVDLKLDLAMPKESNGPFPAVVCVHGGGWKAGNRQSMEKTIETLAARGYVGLTVSYRLTPAAHFPAQIEDCKAAVRWLRANAAKYHVNPERIGPV